MRWPLWWTFIVTNRFMGRGRKEVAYLYSPQVVSWLLAVLLLSCVTLNFRAPKLLLYHAVAC